MCIQISIKFSQVPHLIIIGSLIPPYGSSLGEPGAPATPADGLHNGTLNFGLCPCDQLISLGLNSTSTGTGVSISGGSNLADTDATGRVTLEEVLPRLLAVGTLHSADLSAVCVLSSSDIKRPRDLRGKTYASCGCAFSYSVGPHHHLVDHEGTPDVGMQHHH